MERYWNVRFQNSNNNVVTYSDKEDERVCTAIQGQIAWMRAVLKPELK